MSAIGVHIVQGTDRGIPMRTYQQERIPLPFMGEQIAPAADPAMLACKVIAGVMGNAQTGELPLFAWTLGLPQAELLEAVAWYFPELGDLEPMSDQRYGVILHTRPPLFDEMFAFLMRHCMSHEPLRHIEWLARALAAATMGERHFWQDTGLRNRAEVTQLLAYYFPELHARNTQNLKWKRFLYAELGRHLDIGDLQPPGCRRCDQVTLCFTQRKAEE